MYICNIIPIQKGIPLDTLSYFSNKELAVGTVVVITIGNSERFGIVYTCRSLIEEKTTLKNAPFTLKKIERVCFYHNHIAALTHSLFVTQKNTLAPLGVIASACLSHRYLELILKGFEKKKFECSVLPQKKLRKNRLTEALIATTTDRYHWYRERIRSAFAQSQSVVILVPTIRDAEIIHREVSKGIGRRTVCLHSKKKASEIVAATSLIVSEPDPVVIIATPSFSFVPRNDIGIIAIENESSDFYLSNDRFHIDTRILIESYAEQIGADLYAADIAPRFETIARFHHSRFPVFESTRKLELVEPTSHKQTFLPAQALELISYALQKKKNVFLFSHRRGLAPISRCKDCGTVVQCPHCSLPLVLKDIPHPENKDEKFRAFICNSCGYKTSAHHTCTVCRGWNIVPQRIGTDSIIEELRTLYGESVSVVELEHIQKKLTDSTDGEARAFGKIYVGTEYLLPYLSDIDYSIVPFFDRLISTPSYETMEKALRLMLTVCESTENQVLICTKSNAGIFDKLKKGTVERFIEEELTLREQFGFPPYGIFLKITITIPISSVSRVIEKSELAIATYVLNPLSLPPKRASTETTIVQKSWIILTTKEWMESESNKLLRELIEITPQVFVERNPHYFS